MSFAGTITVSPSGLVMMLASKTPWQIYHDRGFDVGARVAVRATGTTATHAFIVRQSYGPESVRFARCFYRLELERQR